MIYYSFLIKSLLDERRAVLYLKLMNSRLLISSISYFVEMVWSLSADGNMFLMYYCSIKSSFLSNL